MIIGYVMALYIYTGAGWRVEKPIDNDLYPSYEICEQYANTIVLASSERIECRRVKQ